MSSVTKIRYNESNKSKEVKKKNSKKTQRRRSKTFQACGKTQGPLVYHMCDAINLFHIQLIFILFLVPHQIFALFFFIPHQISAFFISSPDLDFFFFSSPDVGGFSFLFPHQILGVPVFIFLTRSWRFLLFFGSSPDLGPCFCYSSPDVGVFHCSSPDVGGFSFLFVIRSWAFLFSYFSPDLWRFLLFFCC